MVAPLNSDCIALRRLLEFSPVFVRDRPFDVGDGLLSRFPLPMRHQPTRALRDEPAQIENHYSDDRAGAESDAPPYSRSQKVRVQQYYR